MQLEIKEQSDKQSFINNHEYSMSQIHEENVSNTIIRFLITEYKKLHTLNSLIMSQNIHDGKILGELQKLHENLLTLTEKMFNEKKPSEKYIQNMLDNLNWVKHEIYKLNNILKQKSINSFANKDELTISPISIFSSVSINPESIKIPFKTRLINYIKTNIISIFMLTMLAFFILSLLYGILVSFHENQKNTKNAVSFNSKINVIARTPENIQTMLEKEYFTQDTFRSYVILLEKTNQEQDKSLQWNISFNDKSRFIALEKDNLSQSECRTMVALKEISFDSASMKINNLSAPINHWTASDSSKWEQQVNQDLCSLNNNKINIAFSSTKVKDDLNRLNGMKESNLNFLIQQHEIAQRYNNSSKVNNALTKKIKELNQALSYKKTQIKA